MDPCECSREESGVVHNNSLPSIGGTYTFECQMCFWADCVLFPALMVVFQVHGLFQTFSDAARSLIGDPSSFAHPKVSDSLPIVAWLLGWVIFLYL